MENKNTPTTISQVIDRLYEIKGFYDLPKNTKVKILEICLEYGNAKRSLGFNGGWEAHERLTA